jgi:cytochrome c peroxidase
MLLCSFVLLSCERDIPVVEAIDYNPTSVAFDVPKRFPTPNLPADNPLTEEGIALGKKLFYDPILSGNNTLSWN